MMKLMTSSVSALLVLLSLQVATVVSAAAAAGTQPRCQFGGFAMELTKGWLKKRFPIYSKALAHISKNSDSKKDVIKLKRKLKQQFNRLAAIPTDDSKAKMRFWAKCIDLRKQISRIESEMEDNWRTMRRESEKQIASDFKLAKEVAFAQMFNSLMAEFKSANGERIGKLSKTEVIEETHELAVTRLKQLPVAFNWESLSKSTIKEYIADYWKSARKLKAGNKYVWLIGSNLFWDLSDFENGELHEIFERNIELNAQMQNGFWSGNIQVPVELLSEALAESGIEMDAKLLSHALEAWPELNQIWLQMLVMDLEMNYSIARKVMFGDQSTDELLLPPLASPTPTSLRKQQWLDTLNLASACFSAQLQLKKRLLSTLCLTERHSFEGNA